jgi:hypothetical protein
VARVKWETSPLDTNVVLWDFNGVIFEEEDLNEKASTEENLGVGTDALPSSEFSF